MLTGDNGILTQAKKAKEETDEAQEDELRKLTALEAVTNVENTTYRDKNGQTAPVPAGFAVSQIEGENVIEEGLVIIDSKENEFVWIPVTEESQYIRNTTYENQDVSATAYTDTGYLPDGIQPIIDNSTNNENAEKDAVLQSGGFYISRYEAGKEGTNTLVSKRGATVWTNISQVDSKAISKTFVSNVNVKSALCSGIQWDVIMKFIDGKKDGNGNVFDVGVGNEERHLTEVNVSGKNEADKVCNIYDLESNCGEFVAEKNSFNSTEPYSNRGGVYDVKTSCASRRFTFAGKPAAAGSFRIVLYVM